MSHYIYYMRATLKIHGGGGRFAPVSYKIAPVRLLTGAIAKLKIAPVEL